MSKSKSKVDKAKLEQINDLFDIEIKKYDITLEEILMLPVEALKGISVSVAEELADIFEIRNIGDLLTKEINKTQVRRSTKKGISIGDLETWRFIAKKIYSIEGLVSEEKNVAILGLRGAGKSTLVQLLKEDVGLQSLLSTMPTGEEANQDEISAKNFNISLWSVNSNYAEKFMNRISAAYFKKVDLILFVIDIQDSSKFEDVMVYFNKVIKMVDKLEENPDFFIVFNKADPKFLNTPTYQSNFENVKPRIVNLLESKEIKHDFFLSSIYNALDPHAASAVRNILDSVKKRKRKGETVSEEPTLEDKFEELYAVVDNMFDLVLKLTSSINSRLELIEYKVGITEFDKIPDEPKSQLLENAPVTKTEIRYDPKKTGLGPKSDAFQKREEKSELISEMKKILALKKIE